MLTAPPQPVVLATSADSYLVAPAAGRHITAWLEYPAAHALSPDEVVQKVLPSRPLAFSEFVCLFTEH
jgi:hypothetical protein